MQRLSILVVLSLFIVSACATANEKNVQQTVGDSSTQQSAVSNDYAVPEFQYTTQEGIKLNAMY
ncbi:MAG TPA: hypothetical protein PL059_02615, partial [Spirochaetota bacterium]|nr:hypothetical protein [Spirochaetota bacterium]